MTQGNHLGTRRIRRAGTPSSSQLTSARNLGYEDARRGLPFRREYETMSETLQRAYERGRQQWALVHRALGGTARDPLPSPAPRWPRNMRLETLLRRCLGDDAAVTVLLATKAHVFNDMTVHAEMLRIRDGR